MSEEVKLNRQVYEKQQYRKVINTTFTELTSTSVEDQNTVEVIPSVDEFFTTYQQLFYTIPKTGLINSHEYIAKQSGEYVGTPQVNQEIEALLEEVTTLREENYKLLEQLVNLKITNG